MNMKKQTNKQEIKPNAQAKLFYLFAIIMLLYMGFSAFTSYQTFVDYCKMYQLDMGKEWFNGFKSILAAVIPCFVYAATLYGIGYLIEYKNDN